MILLVDNFPGLGGGGVFLGILGEEVPPGSPNADTISDQKMSFTTPVLVPFSDLVSKK